MKYIIISILFILSGCIATPEENNSLTPKEKPLERNYNYPSQLNGANSSGLIANGNWHSPASDGPENDEEKEVDIPVAWAELIKKITGQEIPVIRPPRPPNPGE